MSIKNKAYFRRVYTIMDYMSEMGGLFGAIGSIFLAIIVGLNYFGSYQFLIAELFYNRRIRDDVCSDNIDGTIVRKNSEIDIQPVNNV